MLARLKWPALFGVAGLVALWGMLAAPPWRSEQPLDAARGGLPDDDLLVVGALHVHSRYSDGLGDLNEISKAASDAGLDFWVLTDHQRLDALSEEGEGYSDGVLRLIGVEVSTETGHILGLDLPPSPIRFGSNADEALRQIREMGGFALAAHPTADRPDFAWADPSFAGLDGIEIFNTYSAYRRAGIARSLAYLLLGASRQTDWLGSRLDWDPDLLGAWARVPEDRKLVAWAGTDAHGGTELIADYALAWPSYSRLFATARNYVFLDEPLSGELGHDRDLVYRGLREGRGYVALEDRPGADLFRFWLENSEGRWPTGSDVVFDAQTSPWTLRASLLPEVPAEMVLLRDGVAVARSVDGGMSFEVVAPGIYRVEVSVRTGDAGSYRPWIQSNPIGVLPQSLVDARGYRDGARPTGVAVEPVPAPWFADGLNPVANEECRLIEIDGPEGAASGFGLRFALGAPPAGAPPDLLTPFARCGAAYYAPYDLSPYTGLRFRVRADAIYRVFLELHDPNPRSSANGMEPWAVSFLTSPEWKEIDIPFDEFRSAGPASDGSLDLADVGRILLLIDTWNTRPGTAGSVEIEGFSLLAASRSTGP